MGDQSDKGKVPQVGEGIVHAPQEQNPTMEGERTPMEDRTTDKDIPQCDKPKTETQTYEPFHLNVIQQSSWGLAKEMLEQQNHHGVAMPITLEIKEINPEDQKLWIEIEGQNGTHEIHLDFLNDSDVLNPDIMDKEEANRLWKCNSPFKIKLVNEKESRCYFVDGGKDHERFKKIIFDITSCKAAQSQTPMSLNDEQLENQVQQDGKSLLNTEIFKLSVYNETTWGLVKEFLDVFPRTIDLKVEYHVDGYKFYIRDPKNQDGITLKNKEMKEWDWKFCNIRFCASEQMLHGSLVETKFDNQTVTFELTYENSKNERPKYAAKDGSEDSMKFIDFLNSTRHEERSQKVTPQEEENEGYVPETVQEQPVNETKEQQNDLITRKYVLQIYKVKSFADYPRIAKTEEVVFQLRDICDKEEGEHIFHVSRNGAEPEICTLDFGHSFNCFEFQMNKTCVVVDREQCQKEYDMFERLIQEKLK